MNKPAPQEPSMDEILSSIRQIIADDDAGARRTAPTSPPANSQAPAAPAPMSLRPQVAMPVAATPEPLALSTAQIVPPTPAPEPVPAEPAPAVEPPLSYQSILAGEQSTAGPVSERDLVDPEDIAFESEGPEPAPAPVPPPMARPMPSPRPSASVSRVAPMPDPRLSADIAERLIEPATRAAVQSNFAKLSGVTQVPGGQTIDGMMRDMLRPMLKAWLDEHLPAVVERMVEKEIVRISRGVE
jgi:cell pole-organizing protein PopZ